MLLSTTSRTAGFVIVIVATVLWSTAGLFVRLADLDLWSLVAWRSIFSLITLGSCWVVISRSKAKALRATMTLPGAAAMLIGGTSAISYILALQLTSVANVMTVYAALPFIAGAIASSCSRKPSPDGSSLQVAWL